MSKLPTSFTPDNSDPLIFNDELRAYTVEAYGTDRRGYLEGDMPSKAFINAGHGHVFITGAVGENAHFRGRQCVYSAATLPESTSIDGGILFVAGDQSDLAAVKAVSGKFDTHSSPPPILVVPEAKRVAIMDLIAQSQIRTETVGIPIRTLQEVQAAFPDTSMQLYFAGEEVNLPPVKVGKRGRAK